MSERCDDPNNEPNPKIGPSREFVDGTEPIHDTLSEIRDRIDEIDIRIVSYLAERAMLVKDATRFKKDALEVPAIERQRAVIDRVGQLAEAQEVTLDGFPSLVVQVYELLVPGFVELQRQALENTRVIEGEAIQADLVDID